MRNRIVTMAAAAALTVSGCKAIGWVEESNEDWTTHASVKDEVLNLPDPEKVVVEKIVPDLLGNPPSVELTLRNDGVPYPMFTFDVEFGFPAPAGSFAPYIPHFESQDLEEFKTGESRTLKVEAVTAPPPGTPYFVKVAASTGADVRMTAQREVDAKGPRTGTTFLRGRIEVVEVDAQLTASKPKLSITLENVDAKNPAEPIGDLRYLVQFFKARKPVDLGDISSKFSKFRSVGKPLGAKGERIVVEVGGLEEVVDRLGGASYVLRLKQ